MSMIWPPHSVKIASTPSFLSALATRLPPEIFWLASAATPGAALSDGLLTAPAMFILLHERFHFGAERSFNRMQSHDSYIVSSKARQTVAPLCASVPRSLTAASSRGCRTIATMRGSAVWLATAKMIRDHLGYATGDPLAGGDVEKLVGAVRIRMRTKHARDQELRLRKALAQHVGERDRATFAHV